MFRAAFPHATEQDEQVEMRWITTGSRGKYGDTAKAGHEDDESKKLSGTWSVISLSRCVQRRERLIRIYIQDPCRKRSRASSRVLDLEVHERTHHLCRQSRREPWSGFGSQV